MDSLINKDFFPSGMTLDENRIFPVLVMSTMSSGKSTLINAIADREILPNRNEACTAKVYAILDEDENEHPYAISVDDKQRVRRIEGNLREKLDELNEREDTEKIFIGAQIREVINTGKILLLIDTPGMNNALDERHERITEDALQALNGGLVLYLINATQFGVRDDTRLLKILQNRLKQTGEALRVLFVINKVDELDPEKEPIEDFIPEVRSYLIQRGFSDPELIPISARAASLFRKALREEELSRAEYRDFLGYYENFGTKDLRLSSYKMGRQNAEFFRRLQVKGKEYRISELNAAIENTGITAIERYIQNAQIQSEERESFRIKLPGEQRREAEEREKEREDLFHLFMPLWTAKMRTIGIFGPRKYHAAIINMLLRDSLIPEDAWRTVCRSPGTFSSSSSLLGIAEELPYLELQGDPGLDGNYKLIDIDIDHKGQYKDHCRELDRTILGNYIKTHGYCRIRGYFPEPEELNLYWRIRSCDALVKQSQADSLPKLWEFLVDEKKEFRCTDPDLYVHVPLYVIDLSSFSDRDGDWQLELLLRRRKEWGKEGLERCIFVLDYCEKLGAEGSTLFKKMGEICRAFSQQLQIEHPILVPVSSAMSSRLWSVGSKEFEKVQEIAMECHDKNLECEKYALIDKAVRERMESDLSLYRRVKDLRVEIMAHTGAYVLETVLRLQMRKS